MVDRLSKHFTTETIVSIPILEVPPTLSMRYTYSRGFNVILIYLGMIGFSPLFGGAAGFVILLVGFPLLLIPFWIITTLSKVVATADGIYRRYWYGREQWMKWSEIASLEHNDLTGTVSLYDFSRKKVIRFNHNRINFDKFATLLVVLCPHLWRYETQRHFHAHPMKYLYYLGVMGIALGLVYIIALQNVVIAFVVAWVLFFGSLVILWRYPNHLILSRDHLEVHTPSRKQQYHFAHMAEVQLAAEAKRDQAMSHSVRFLYQGKNWSELLFSGYKGGTLTLYCTLHRALLDYRSYPTTVRWVETPKK